MEPWVDFNDLQPGQRWREELERAIDAAQWFVILVGAKSRATPWQEAEWSAALARSWADHEKRVLPVVFGEGDAPPFLRNCLSLGEKILSFRFRHGRATFSVLCGISVTTPSMA